MVTLTVVVALFAVGCAPKPVVGEPGPPPTRAVPPLPTASAPVSGSTDSDEIVLAFAGDVHFTDRTAKLLANPKTAFGPVSDVFTAADLAMVNMETAITTKGKAEPKQYHFRAPATAYEAAKAAGIDVVTQANNHTLDYGQEGLVDTIEAAKAAQLPMVGAGRTAAEAWAPWVTEVKGTKIAFLGISQISELASTWTARDNRPGIAHSNDVQRSINAVKAAKAQAKIVVVYMHWGHEGNQCADGEQKAFAQKLTAAGADVIVGTHAHLLQGDGWLGKSYVAYGLGNFLWWWDDAYSNDTGVLRVRLRADKVADATLVPARIGKTGQPIPASGAEATRITQKFAQLRGCTGLSAKPAG